MTQVSKKGLKFTVAGQREPMKKFIEDAIDKQVFDAVLMPMMVPSKDSYAWMLIKDKEYLKDAEPIAPIMPINAANALKKYTRKGKAKFKIAALIRPCEVRATIELTKLNQINLEDVILISYDCVGALPMQNFIADPQKSEKAFNNLLDKQIWDSKDVKEVCKICDKFSLPNATDLHFAIDGTELVLIPNSEKGSKIFTDMKLEPKTVLTNWKKKIEKIATAKKKSKEETHKIIKTMTDGLDNLAETFSNCIGCHNCGSVCPICYCRKCYFDSTVAKPNSDIKMMRAEQRGAISLPLDRLMYHTGRMAHMSLSCVSCGLCTDACPVNIPVAKIFSYVGTQTQKTFDYVAGENAGDPLPMKDYRLDELGELGEMSKKAEVQESGNE